MNPSLLTRRIGPLVTICRGTSTQAEASAKLVAFRRIVHARKSVKRFEPNRQVPGGVWKDILRMTLVRDRRGLFMIFFACCLLVETPL